MIGTPLSSSGGVQVRLMHVLDALSTFGVPGGPESTKKNRSQIDQPFSCFFFFFNVLLVQYSIKSN